MLALVGGDRHVAVKGDTVHRGAAQAALYSLFTHRSKPVPITLKPQGLTSPRPESDTLLAAGFDRLRHRWVQFMKIIRGGLFHLGEISILGQQSLSLQTANDPLGDGFAQCLYLSVVGRWQGNELHRTILAGLVVKPICHENVSMKI